MPAILRLPCDLEDLQCDPPDDACRVRVKGDFLFHCHLEEHMMAGLAGLVRARDWVWVDPKTVWSSDLRLPLDVGRNDLDWVDLVRRGDCATGDHDHPHPHTKAHNRAAAHPTRTRPPITSAPTPTTAATVIPSSARTTTLTATASRRGAAADTTTAPPAAAATIRASSARCANASVATTPTEADTATATTMGTTSETGTGTRGTTTTTDGGTRLAVQWDPPQPGSPRTLSSRPCTCPPTVGLDRRRNPCDGGDGHAGHADRQAGRCVPAG